MCTQRSAGHGCLAASSPPPTHTSTSDMPLSAAPPTHSEFYRRAKAAVLLPLTTGRFRPSAQVVAPSSGGAVGNIVIDLSVAAAL